MPKRRAAARSPTERPLAEETLAEERRAELASHQEQPEVPLVNLAESVKLNDNVNDGQAMIKRGPKRTVNEW